jgi:hypothetical protein
MEERFAIALDVTLSLDGKKYTVYWIQDEKDIVMFHDALTAKIILAKEEMESSELVFLTNMRVVQVSPDSRFITFPDEVQVPLLSTGKKIANGDMEYDAVYFHVKVMANDKLRKKVDEMIRSKGIKFVMTE